MPLGKQTEQNAKQPADKLTINRHSEVSVKEQLVTQLMIRITSGHYQAGDTLPSIRQLAQQLGVHYNTCLAVYQKLEDIGLVERQRGSGTRVRAWKNDPTSPAHEPSLYYLADQLVHHAHQQGLTPHDLLPLLQTRWKQHGFQTVETPLVYVDRMPDILPLFQAELQAHLSRDVQTCSLTELEVHPSSYLYTHWITSTYYAHAVQQLLDTGQISGHLTVIPTNSAMPIREKMMALPSGALVVVISVSTIILQQAEAIIQALRGHDLLVSLRLKNELSLKELNTLLSHAQLVIGDSLTHPFCQELTRKPVERITVIPDEALKSINL